MIIQDTQQWFESSLGRYLIDQEYRYFDQVVINIFGYNAVQIGLSQFNFLRLNRIPLLSLQYDDLVLDPTPLFQYLAIFGAY